MNCANAMVHPPHASICAELHQIRVRLSACSTCEACCLETEVVRLFNMHDMHCEYVSFLLVFAPAHCLCFSPCDCVCLKCAASQFLCFVCQCMCAFLPFIFPDACFTVHLISLAFDVMCFRIYSNEYITFYSIFKVSKPNKIMPK